MLHLIKAALLIVNKENYHSTEWQWTLSNQTNSFIIGHIKLVIINNVIVVWLDSWHTISFPICSVVFPTTGMPLISSNSSPSCITPTGYIWCHYDVITSVIIYTGWLQKYPSTFIIIYTVHFGGDFFNLAFWLWLPSLMYTNTIYLSSTMKQCTLNIILSVKLNFPLMHYITIY